MRGIFFIAYFNKNQNRKIKKIEKDQVSRPEHIAQHGKAWRARPEHIAQHGKAWRARACKARHAHILSLIFIFILFNSSQHFINAFIFLKIN
jgi:hypothetical protein